MVQRILIIDDDPQIVDLLRLACKGEPTWEIDHCGDGLAGLERVQEGNFHLLVVDLSLPGLSGMDICRKLTELETGLPILILSSRSDEIDKVLGLEVGADDYVVKPFSPRELVARIRALLRRSEKARRAAPAAGPLPPLIFGTLTIDRARRDIQRAGITIPLTGVEYDLVLYLAERKGAVVVRDILTEEVLGYDSVTYDSALTTHMSRIRGKLEPDPQNPTFIHTIRGVGYRFDDLGAAGDLPSES